MPPPFLPRFTFPPPNVPQSYFLGHHASGLSRIRTLLTQSQIDLVLEVRDYRTPLTSRNPAFEAALGSVPRLIVYSHADLGRRIGAGTGDGGRSYNRRWEEQVRRIDGGERTEKVFVDVRNREDVQGVLKRIEWFARSSGRVEGLKKMMMVVGMPNVGKSSLLNAVRVMGIAGVGKAARTGDQPGITRKLATSVKVIAGGEKGEGAVYLLDTPGVFVPYVPDAESMLKLALCGNVKDTIVPPTTVADYLLYKMNLTDPNVYKRVSEPTNDIIILLERLARQRGRLKKGGVPDVEAAALIFIQQWRGGEMGRFVLDTIGDDLGVSTPVDGYGGSLNQARKAAKAEKLEDRRARLDSSL